MRCFLGSAAFPMVVGLMLLHTAAAEPQTFAGSEDELLDEETRGLRTRQRNENGSNGKKRLEEQENGGGWQVNDDLSWCVPNYKESHPTGLIYIKINKAASSTNSGVALRIAHNVGKRVFGQQRANELENNGEEIKDYEDGDNFTGPRCAVKFHHGLARLQNYENRNPRRSYMWTMVRDPTARALSHFFHFSVSRNGVEPTDENIIKGLKGNHSAVGSGGFQLRYLAPTTGITLSSTNMTHVEDTVDNIASMYDFIGVVERLDESVVALRLLLGIEAGDVLHMDSKISGGYDARCFKLVKHDGLSSTVTSFLRSDEWLERNVGDTMLHDLANRRLDATIDAIGKQKFAEALDEHKRLTQLVHDKCAASTIFPCMDGVLKRAESKSNCYWNDSGCGYPCMDKVIESLEETA